MEQNVAKAVGELARLDFHELRAAWPARLGPSPRHRSVDLLRRELAWRLQAEAHGGLDPLTLAELAKPAGAARRPELTIGTRLVREWQGERHEVEVGENGVIHRGTTYTSLSQAARAITGVRWNGPRFFGLREAS